MFSVSVVCLQALILLFNKNVFVDSFYSSNNPHRHTITRIPRSSSSETLLPSSSILSSIHAKESRQTNSSLKQSSSSTEVEDRRRQSRKQHDPLLSLNLNLDAMAMSQEAPVAQEMLQRIRALYKEGYYEVSPDIVSYNSVLKAWKEDNNPEAAYDYLKQMMDSSIRVDVISFNTVIFAFAKNGNYKMAKQIIKQMRQREDLPDPETLTYNALLYALANSRDKGTVTEAHNWLLQMIDNKLQVSADTTSFNTVIFAWSQIANKSNLKAAQNAQQLLKKMEDLALAGNTNVTPDVYTYTTVIQAWAKCEQSLNSQKLLDAMTLKGLLPNRYTYTAVMSSLAKTGMPQKAEAILNSMMLAYQHGNTSLKPDTVAFSSVMDGWARLSHVDKPWAADCAISLLERMKVLKKEGMGPNARTYTSVLSAVAKSGTWEACEKAVAILKEMKEEYYKNGNSQLKPTVIHYNSVLHAYARSPRADKALKAAGFLKQMEYHSDPECRPDIISYNSVLMSCANAFGNKELKHQSFHIATDTLKTIMAISRPSSTTFVHFCKACRRLIDSKQQRNMALRRTLNLCCRKGMLNHVVVHQVKLSCKSEAEWKEIAGDLAGFVGIRDQFKKTDVPKEWICNAGR